MARLPRFTYKYVKEYIEKEGYTLLSTEYKNNKTKIKIKCGKNHVYDQTFGNFKQGRRCLICNNINKRHSYDYIKEKIEKEGYKLLSKEYKNCEEKLHLICPKNHHYYVSFHNWKDGCRCYECFGNKPNNKKEVKSYIELFGYKLLSEYKGCNKIIWLKCDKEHKFKTTWKRFKKGQRCPECWIKSYSSKPEKEIQEYIKTFYFKKIINNDRNTIKNPLTNHYLELDVYLPDKKLAIEYNGDYWHSFDDVIVKDKIKKDKCKKLGINLLVIKEEFFINNKEDTLKKIKNFIIGE